MVQLNAAAVLEMTNKDGGAHEAMHALAIIFANSEGIWNNYIDIQQKNMQVKITTI